MQYNIRGQAIGTYRLRIDPTVDDDGAEAAILAALMEARETERRPESVRLRAPRRSGRPWSRCYITVGVSGDVIDVRPERAGTPPIWGALECSRRDRPDARLLEDLTRILERHRPATLGRERELAELSLLDITRATTTLTWEPVYGSEEWLGLWRAVARACWIAHRWPAAEPVIAQILRTGRR